MLFHLVRKASEDRRTDQYWFSCWENTMHKQAPGASLLSLLEKHKMHLSLFENPYNEALLYIYKFFQVDMSKTCKSLLARKININSTFPLNVR